MKTLAILALLPLTSFADFHPAPGARTVLTLTRFCGFFCPNQDRSGLGVDSSGAVYFTKSDKNHTGAPELVAQLSADVVARLITSADSLAKEDLVDYDANMPTCEDAGTATYTAVSKKAGGSVTFARNSACHRYGFASHAGDDLVQVLNGLEALTR
jgi:hypothetical protein